MARANGKDRGIVEKPPGSGRWWVRVHAHGRERRYRCDSKGQAKALYGRLRADLREEKFFPEKYAAKKDITLRAWTDRCLAGSANRGLRNEKRYGRFWKHLIGKRLLREVTTEDLRRVQARLREKGEKSAGTVNRYFAYLRRVFSLAAKDGLLDRNPCSGIKLLPEAKRTRFLSDGEIARLKEAMSPKDWDLVAFAIESGLRRAEQFNLRWEDVSLDAGTLTIPLPKGGRTRHVPLTPYALGMLRKADSFLVSPWVFPAPTKPSRPRESQAFVNRVFLPALDEAGIEGASWHTLRHTAASRRVMAGADLTSVQAFLGHRDIATTLRYAHLSQTHLREAVSRGSLGGEGRAETGNPAKNPDGTGTKTGTDAIRQDGAGKGSERQAVDNPAGIGGAP
ncbi:MAG: site-specific integrase [Nitrospirae bacterium]|nr:site-specific integrase [Nitrospirota bacterium]